MATSILTLLLLGVIINLSLNLAAGEESNPICSNAACVSAAKDLLSHIDETVNPCDDFYKFACGKFLQNTVIGDDELVISTFMDLQKHVDDRLRKLLEEPIKPDSPKYERFLKKHYQLCTNRDIIEETGVTYLQNFLYKHGGWPLIGQTWNENIDLTKFLVNLKLEMGISVITILVQQNDSDSSKNCLVMMTTSTTFPKEYYNDAKQKNKIDALRQYIINIAKELTGNAKLENLEKDVEDIINFDKRLAEISLPLEESRLVRHEKITLDKFVALFNKTIRFDEFIGGLLSKVNIQAKKDEPINVYEYSFFKGLAALLEKTPKRVVINYSLWQVVKSMIDALPKRFEDIATQYDSVISGSSKAMARWKKCVSLLIAFFKQMGAMYVKSYFGQSAKIKTMEILEELKPSFRTMIQGLSWLQNDTKARALEKLLYMRNITGYPESLDHENLDETFENVIEPQTFLGANIIILSILTMENLNLLKKAVDPKNPDIGIANANAYYSSSINSIIVTAGILQAPVFSESQPMYLNYGGIGNIIGHEITHAFDDIGKNYNKDGNAVNWWKDEDENKFINASQCFVDQYNNFVVEDLNEHVNGRLTLGENIADNGGLRAAFQAYQNWIKRNGKEPSLPGLNYSPLQMFFINIGRVFCEKSRPEFALRSLKDDNHSPGRFRILGIMQNFEGFSDTFNCPLGTPMNPFHKCRIW